MNLQTLAERFCAAPLPDSVCADLIATQPTTTFRRTGTNLLTVDEAKAVLSHVLGGDVCTWEEDEEGVWYSCLPDGGGRNAFSFEDGGPDDNEFQFCPYCGKPLVAISHGEPLDAE